jgi:hypothetical protein
MAMKTPETEADQSLSLAQRRAYIKLPFEERRHRLAARADQMEESYEQQPEKTEREAWQGGILLKFGVPTL